MVSVTTTDSRTATPATRALVATVLYISAEKPKYSTATDFEDVSETTITMLFPGHRGRGIVARIRDTEFAQNKTLNCQELVTMMQKYCEVMDMDTNDVDTGSDEDLENKVDFIKISEWAIKPMEWAFKVGAIFGLTEDTIDPLDVVTRAQLAQIVYKVMTYQAPADDPVDNTADNPGDGQ